MQATYPIKVQAIRTKGRTNRLYVGIPLALAAAIDMQPGEEVEWELLDRGELHLVRSDVPAVRAKRNQNVKLRGGFSAESNIAICKDGGHRPCCDVCTFIGK